LETCLYARFCWVILRWIRFGFTKPEAGRRSQSTFKLLQHGLSGGTVFIRPGLKSLRDLRVAEVVEQDIVIEKGKVAHYRTKVKLSFKYEGK